MATTQQREFHGRARLTKARLDTLKERYVGALGDADKASDVLGEEYWQGYADALEDALALLHGEEVAPGVDTRTEEA